MGVDRATERDLAGVEALLAAAGLPLEGTREAFTTGVVVRDREAVLAAAAIEPFGDLGLLRSVVVESARRGEGLGRAVVGAAEAIAVDLGIGELYLLTETAAEWFRRLGYEPVPGADVPPAVRASVEFGMACAETAVAMRRRLAGAS